MDEEEIISKVKEKQGLISKIQNALLAGYAVKEDLRELDKMLRESYYDNFREYRYRWEKAYLEALETGQTGVDSAFKTVLQTMDRIMAKIRRGDYGYAGLLDRKGHIRKSELAHVFSYDKELEGDVGALGEGIEKVSSSVDEEDWDAVPGLINSVRDSLLRLESKWMEREKRFRKVDV